MNIWYQRIRVITVLIVGSTLANLLGSQVLRDIGAASAWSAAVCGILIGCFIAQINLVALWAAMAPGTAVVRLPWAFLLTVVMIITFGSGLDADDQIVLIAVVFTGQVVSQIPYCVAARARCYQVGFFDDSDFQPQRASRFGIKSMMISTAIIATTLALLRMTMPTADFSALTNRQTMTECATVLLPIVITNLVFIAPSVWLGFRSSSSLRRIAATLIPFLVLAAAIELIVLTFLLGPAGGEWLEVFFLFSLMNITQCLGVFGAIRWLRRYGFRLSDASERKPTPSEIS